MKKFIDGLKQGLGISIMLFIFSFGYQYIWGTWDGLKVSGGTEVLTSSVWNNMIDEINKSKRQDMDINDTTTLFDESCERRWMDSHGHWNWATHNNSGGGNIHSAHPNGGAVFFTLDYTNKKRTYQYTGGAQRGTNNQKVQYRCN